MIFTKELFTTVAVDATLAALLGFLVAMALTPLYTGLAYKYKAWKRASTGAITGEKAKVYLKLHAEKHKRKIPTMAGVVIIASVAIVSLFLDNISRAQTALPLLALLGGGLVGLIDDYLNIRGANVSIAGLRSQIKLFLITAVASVGAFYFFYRLGYSNIHIPWYGQLEIGWLLIPLFIFVVIATANAVNITDGLDGLSGGLLTFAFFVYTVIALLGGNFGIAIFCATVVGTMLTYTWFNIYPARFFMGDTGSFALGTTLGVVAMLTDTMLLLPIIGGMFVLEAGSSALQIFSKRVFHRKIFKSAPIHHHFEAMGWPETKVTMRFWVLGAVFGVMGLVAALVGGAVDL